MFMCFKKKVGSVRAQQTLASSGESAGGNEERRRGRRFSGKQKFLISCGIAGASGWIFKKLFLDGNVNNQVN